jgi:NAD(P)-dependent dehydrogenase (short-subunit alcohol dehydrogenase family)
MHGQSTEDERVSNDSFHLKTDIINGAKFGIRACSVHPGAILATDLGRWFSPDEGKRGWRSWDLLILRAHHPALFSESGMLSGLDIPIAQESRTSRLSDEIHAISKVHGMKYVNLYMNLRNIS